MRGSRVVLTALALAGAVALTASVDSRAAPMSKQRTVDNSGPVQVDVELVLAVDISYSMDPEEQALQREGYVEALTSKEFLQALRQGMLGKVAITYVEWAGSTDQRQVMPWRVIDGPESADAVRQEIMKLPYRRASRTSISGALLFSAPLFEKSGYQGARRVIDVSGDGANNDGQLVTVARDEVLAKGIVINGLPIMLKRPMSSTMDIEELDIYYEDCVIGGQGAFVVPIRDREKFRDAIRTKLVLEIAQKETDHRVIPASADQPRLSCSIGERLRNERWGN